VGPNRSSAGNGTLPGGRSPLGRWDPPGRIDVMIGGSGGIRSGVGVAATVLKILYSSGGLLG
jgi:hypothetical protein